MVDHNLEIMRLRIDQEALKAIDGDKDAAKALLDDLTKVPLNQILKVIEPVSRKMRDDGFFISGLEARAMYEFGDGKQEEGAPGSDRIDSVHFRKYVSVPQTPEEFRHWPESKPEGHNLLIDIKRKKVLYVDEAAKVIEDLVPKVLAGDPDATSKLADQAKQLDGMENAFVMDQLGEDKFHKEFERTSGEKFGRMTVSTPFGDYDNQPPTLLFKTKEGVLEVNKNALVSLTWKEVENEAMKLAEPAHRFFSAKTGAEKAQAIAELSDRAQEEFRTNPTKLSIELNNLPKIECKKDSTTGCGPYAEFDSERQTINFSYKYWPQYAPGPTHTRGEFDWNPDETVRRRANPEGIMTDMIGIPVRSDNK